MKRREKKLTQEDIRTNKREQCRNRWRIKEHASILKSTVPAWLTHCEADGHAYSNVTKANLTQHKQIKHDGVRYSCDMCDDKFTSKGAVKAG